jgi:hypothetical protein
MEKKVIIQMVVIVPTFMYAMNEVMRKKGFRILSKMNPKGDILSQSQYP